MISEESEILPPHDIAAERCLIAALWLTDGNHAAFSATAAAVKPQMFFQVDHQIIYGAMVDMHTAGRAIDGETLRAKLGPLYDEVGGTKYLAQILASVPSAAHMETYAAQVAEMHARRQVIKAANEMLREAYSGQSQGREVAQRGMQDLAKIIQCGGNVAYEKLSAAVARVWDSIGKGGIQAVPTTIPPLDQIVGGVGAGEMCIIAARPSMGKSTLTRQMAVGIARAGYPVGLISLEESAEKIARNLISAESGIENGKVRGGNVCQEEWDEIASGCARLNSVPLYLSQRARKMADIKAVASLMVDREGCRVLMLDYMQRIRGVSGKDRYEQTTNTSLELSDMAKELQVPLIVVAQLNRAVESREDKRPQMSDLRDSGQIEQDADGILFLHRDDYYHLDDRDYEPTGMADLIIAKWRDSVRGKVLKLKSNLRYQRFEFDDPDPF